MKHSKKITISLALIALCIGCSYLPIGDFSEKENGKTSKTIHKIDIDPHAIAFNDDVNEVYLEFTPKGIFSISDVDGYLGIQGLSPTRQDEFSSEWERRDGSVLTISKSTGLIAIKISKKTATSRIYPHIQVDKMVADAGFDALMKVYSDNIYPDIDDIKESFGMRFMFPLGTSKSTKNDVVSYCYHGVIDTYGYCIQSDQKNRVYSMELRAE